MEAGNTYTHERTFTEADVRAVADVTGDDQPRHTTPDEGGEHTYLEASVVVQRDGESAPDIVLDATVEGYV